MTSNIVSPSRFHRFHQRLILAATLALGLANPPLHADPGPGLGNLTYDPSELFTATTTPLTTLDNDDGIPQGTGMVAMLRGYLLVPFAADGAGNGSSGGFALLDLSDPRSPSTAFTTHNNTPYRTTSSTNFAGGIGEPHGFTISNNVVCLPINRPGGLEFWDFSDMGDGTAANPPSPQKLSRLLLPGLESSGYTRSVFSVAWQGDYVYVAGTGLGLFIVDASDPANPVLLDRGPGNPNPIPLSQTGNFPVGFVHPIGNLLVLSRTENGVGLSTLDISDPANPALLYASTTDNSAYSTTVNGNRIYGANGRIWDIDDPATPTFVAQPNTSGMSTGGYVTVQDHFMHLGMSNGYLKADVSGNTAVTVGTVFPGVSGADYDFANVAGNLIIIGDDHARGTPIYPHQLAPDTTGPEVNMVVPADGALNQATTSRIGFTLTDQLEPSSVNASTIIIRPLGTTTPLAGTYTVQTAGVVNFWPDQPLAADASYEIIVPAGGVRDWAGNPSATTFTAAFSTGSEIADPITLTLDEGSRSISGDAWLADATVTHPDGAVEVSWNFGDGSPATAFSTTTGASHTYSEPGHYLVSLNARLASDPDITRSTSFTHTVHRPLVGTPRSSATLIHDTARDRIWTVNRDNHSVTRIKADTLAKLSETPVGDEPVALTQLPNGDIWVVHRNSHDIKVLDPDTAAVTATHPLPYASMPGGILASPDGTTVFVTLEATGRLVELSAATGQILRSLDVGPVPRGLGFSADGIRLFLSRFISPDDAGKIIEVDPAAFTVTRTIDLAIDTTPDAENAGRGLPNYLGAPAVGPDNTHLWIPSKKDNIQRGTLRDGQDLTFENTVRPIVSVIDLATSTEVPAARVDLNDRAMPVAVTHSAIGDYAFVLNQGSNAIDVIDAYSGNVVTAVDPVGKAPHGLLIDHARQRLIVHNFMSRDVSVFDIAGILDTTSLDHTPLATIPTVASESLTHTVLLGKQLFYDGRDIRLTRDSYMSCASCHDDGGQDGRVWDFTGSGEGLRNTISLQGRQGTSGHHGRAHWSGNFDEIHDFENQIRKLNDGTGLMDDADFVTGTRSEPLGDPKTGVSPDLDALVAYLESLDTFPASPHREPDGQMTPQAIAGQTHFQTLDCASCHSGEGFTDSPLGLRHDIGTLTSDSGQRLGSPLDGIDTPTLRDVWKTAPYLHDGSAVTLEAVFTSAAPGTAHGVANDLDPAEFDEFIAYLKQIDGTTPGLPESDPPEIVSTFPGHLAANVPLGAQLVVLFNEGIHSPAGTLAIRRADDGSIVEAFDLATSPYITTLAAGFKITPSAQLPYDTTCYVTLDANAVSDTQGNGLLAVNSPSVWSFTTTAVPPVLFTNLAVSGSSDPAAYSIETNLDDGVLSYGDRTARYAQIAANAPYLPGADYIRTANDDKSVSGVAISFTLPVNSTVYISKDDRVGTPAFFGTYGFTDTGDNIVNFDNFPSVPFSVFSANLPAGDYTFNNLSSGNSMYTIMAQPFVAPPPANTFANWIGGFDLGGLTAPGDDPDGDGIPNVIENFFGTHPGEFSHGLVSVSATNDSFTFIHPQNPEFADDLTAAYTWSTDLVNFHGHGVANAGTTVSFAATPNTPEAGKTTVTATVTGTMPGRLFIRLEVTE